MNVTQYSMLTKYPLALNLRAELLVLCFTLAFVNVGMEYLLPMQDGVVSWRCCCAPQPESVGRDVEP